MEKNKINDKDCPHKEINNQKKNPKKCFANQYFNICGCDCTLCSVKGAFSK